MSTTISAVAGTTGSGLGSERHIVWAPANKAWWAFAFTGTNVLSSWYSTDGSTWTAGATLTLSGNHNSEGRGLTVACKNILPGVDVVHVQYSRVGATYANSQDIRGTISGTTLTWHSSEVRVGNDVSLASPTYSGAAIEFASDNKLYIGNGALMSDQDVAYNASGVDVGSAEQATGPGWGNATNIDTSQTAEVKSNMLFDIGSGNVLLLSDDGSASSTTTGIVSYYWNGMGWASGVAATGTISAIDKNDWGAISVRHADGTVDVHLVYRTATNTLVHRRWDTGNQNWRAGEVIQSQTTVAGGGVALSTDGVSVWLVVIGDDASNKIRYAQWESSAYNGVGDRWDSWQDGEASSATRTFVGVTKDAVNIGTPGSGNNTILAYWSEGSNLVAVGFSGPDPGGPPGQVTRDVVSSLGSAASSATLTITFSGTQPPVRANEKIWVPFWASWGGAAPSITSVKDNATDVAGGHSFTAGPSSVGSAQGTWGYWLDLPVGAVWSGNYTVTVTFSASVTESDGFAEALGNVATGAPLATNSNNGSTSPATPGSVTGIQNCVYVAAVTDATSANPATFTWPAPFLSQGAQTNGSTQQAGSGADDLNDTGARNPSIVIDSAVWNAIIAVWQGAPTGLTAMRAQPGRTWRRHFQPYQFAPIVATSAGATLSASGDPTSSAATSSLTATASVAVALSGSIAAASSLGATLGVSVALGGPSTATSALTGTLAAQVALAGTSVDVSAVTATASVAAALAGSVAAVSGATATAVESVALAGVVAAASSASGNLQVLSGTQIGGPITASSSFGATLTVATAVSGLLAGTTGVPGTLSVVAALSGSMPGAAQAAATLGVQAALAGSVVGPSGLSATSSLAVAVAGPLSGVGRATATVANAVALGGSAGSVSSLGAAAISAVSLQGGMSALAAWAGLAGSSIAGVGGPGSTQLFVVDAYPSLASLTDAFPATTYLTDAFPAMAVLADAFPATTSLSVAYPVLVFLADINGVSMSFFAGKAIRIANWSGPAATPTGGFRNSAGTLYDPPSPGLRYRLGTQAEVTITGGGLTHDGTGLYSAIFTPAVDGDLMATAVSGDGAYADPVTVKVEPAPM